MPREGLRPLQVINNQESQPNESSSGRPVTRQESLQQKASAIESIKPGSIASAGPSRKRKCRVESNDQNVEQVNKQQVKRRSKLNNGFRRQVTSSNKSLPSSSASSSSASSSSASPSNSSSNNLDHIHPRAPCKLLTLDPNYLLGQLSTERQEKRLLKDHWEQKYFLLEAQWQQDQKEKEALVQQLVEQNRKLNMHVEDQNEKDELIQLLADQQRRLNMQADELHMQAIELNCLKRQTELDQMRIQQLSDKNADNRVNFELLEYQYGIDVTDFL